MALFQAGGVTEIGSLRNIQVRRAGSVVVTFDSYDLLMKGDVSKDIRLQSGDVVFVPLHWRDRSRGEFKRPMVYELVGGETFGDVLVMAGSFTRDAYPAMSTLTRQSDVLGLPEASTMDLSDERQLLLLPWTETSWSCPKLGVW